MNRTVPLYTLIGMVVAWLIATGLVVYLSQRLREETFWADECEAAARVLNPRVCYERWHSLTVPTCDGGTQVLREAP